MEKGFVSIASYIVGKEHIDELGHLNNVHCYSLFEQARKKMSRDIGFLDQEQSNPKRGVIILDISVKFLKEIHAGQEIKIETQAHQYRGPVAVFAQNLTSETGMTCCHVHAKFGILDTQSRTLLPMPKEWEVVLADKLHFSL